MKLHPRVSIVQRASVALDVKLGAWLEQEGEQLTWLEAVRVLNTVMGRWIAYALRQERHGTDEKKADEA